MTTLLIIVVLLFVLGGGGVGDILVGAGSLGPLGVSSNRRAEERALIEYLKSL